MLLSAACVAAMAAQPLAITDPGNAQPEDGAVVDGVYVNPYFALRYPLPPGWKEGLRPPRPSYTGYYVLTTPAPLEGARATILVAVQDAFFAAESLSSAMALVADLAQTSPAGDRITAGPSVVQIAGHPFARVAISETPLSQIVLATEIRCHVVIFTFTSAAPERLEQLAASLDSLSLAAVGSPATAATSPIPACIKDYATKETILKKVDPLPAGPQFLKIPVRIVIGTDGKVKHIHVIRAFPEQRKSIEEALAEWEFKPYRANGEPAEIETGLVFEFKPADLQR